MLVLSRKRGESVIIAGVIQVEVLETHTSKVRLGIHAPDEIKVHRKEVHDAIEAERCRQQREGGR